MAFTLMVKDVQRFRKAVPIKQPYIMCLWLSGQKQKSAKL